jgi:hypothetical protein
VAAAVPVQPVDHVILAVGGKRESMPGKLTPVPQCFELGGFEGAHMLMDEVNPLVESNPEGNSTLLGNLLMHGGNPLLDTQRTLQRVHGAWELREDAVPSRVRDATTVLCNETVGHFPVREDAACRPHPRSSEVCRR